MSRSGDVLERFYGVLLQQIRETRPEYLTTPFSVAEIYQDLVPYQSHRDSIGVEMKGDYEDALFRMLSGEGDYLMLDSEVARQQMQNELAGPNPNPALLREFAALEVRLHPSRVPLGSGSGGPAGATEEPAIDQEIFGEIVAASEDLGFDAEDFGAVDSEEPAIDGEGASEEVETSPDAELELVETEAAPPLPSDVGEEESVEPGLDDTQAASVEPTGPAGGAPSDDGVVGHIETASAPPLAAVEESPPPDEPASTESESSDVLTVCIWCREDLPVRDSVHFCPFCGSDLRPSPCRECGEEMEARWQFCVSCGTDIRG